MGLQQEDIADTAHMPKQSGPAWLQLGDVLVLPAWAANLPLKPGTYVVTALDGDEAFLAPAGEDEAGDLVAAGDSVRIGWPELGYFERV